MNSKDAAMHSTLPRNAQPGQNGSSAAGTYSADAPAGAVVPTTVVSSVSEFQSVFCGRSGTGSASDAFLLCYELPADQVTSDGLCAFQRSVEDAARTHATRVHLFLWDCTNAAFASAKAQLEKQPGHPLLLIVFRGAIADTIRGVSLADMTASEVPRLCSRLASFQSSAKPARVTSGASRGPAGEGGSSGADGVEDQPPPQHLSVDVAKMVGMGKRLMAERKPFYAEKFFCKALLTLDSVAADVDRLVASRAEYDGSVALCLAWAGLAQLVQGKNTVENPYLRRLCQAEDLREFREEPMSETCRAVVTWTLMQASPRPWSEAECSEAKLRAVLHASPHDTAARALLVVTLFLSGDLERAMTEALKLHVCGESYGRVALKHMSTFLGKDHALVTQLGIPSLPGL